MSNLFSALTAKIFGGLAIAALLFGLWTQLQLDGAREALRLVSAERDAAVADKRLCSASVDAAKMLADERKKEAAKAMEIAGKENVIHTERATTILKEVPTADDQCAAALSLLRKYQ